MKDEEIIDLAAKLDLYKYVPCNDILERDAAVKNFATAIQKTQLKNFTEILEEVVQLYQAEVCQAGRKLLQDAMDKGNIYLSRAKGAIGSHNL